MKSLFRPQASRRLWLIPGLFALLAIAYGSLMHNPPTPDLPQGDKWMHFLGYGGLAFVWALALPRKRWQVCLGAGIWGVLMECAQGLFTTYRTFDLLDMLANALGALLGILLFSLLMRLHRD